MSKHILTTPLKNEDIERLHAGDEVILNGVIYTARDAAHTRMIRALDRGENLPMPLDGQVIYYVGPAPTPPGRVIGSAGPTTSYRMDAYTPRLLELGLKATIGKGRRSPEITAAMQQHKALYLAAIGGAGALLASYIKECEIIAYDDLGPEAVRRLVVENFSTIVAVDCHGNDIFAMRDERSQREAGKT